MKTTEITGLGNQNTSILVNALSQLLADYQVHYTNLRNLHWNVKGHGFFVLHEKYEEFYDDAASKIDEIAERILQLDGTPESRFSEYLKVSSIKELGIVECGHEGIEYVLLGIVAQPFARDVLQDVLQGDEIQTAVHEIRTRTEISPRFCRDDSHQGIRAVPAEPLCHILY